jgi:hypothetical protein
MKSQDHLLAQIWKQRWPLLAFALAFQLLENLLFTPAMGLLGRALQARPVVDSTALVGFFLSPRGFLVLFFGASNTNRCYMSTDSHPESPSAMQ